MTQHLFASETTSDKVQLDANFTELYTALNGMQAVHSATYTTDTTSNLYLKTGSGAGMVGLTLGTDSSNGVAYIQSLEPAVSYTSKPLVLNPNGAIVNIGTISATSGKLNVDAAASNGMSVIDPGNTSGRAYALFISNAATCGSITRVGTTSAVVYGTSSDYRMKLSPEPVTGSGVFIDALQPKRWEWVGGGQGVGFIAHEFAAVCPSAVTGQKDAIDVDGVPIYQTMQASASEVMANIIAELQSLRARVTALEAA